VILLAATAAKPPIPSHLWTIPVAGISAAVLTVLIAFSFFIPEIFNRAEWKKFKVNADSAWDASDSWVTNVTAVGSGVAAFVSSQSIGSFVTSVNIDAFALLSLALGGVAVMAPIVYGVSSGKNEGTVGPEGTKTGVALASLVTLISAFGLLATIGLLVSYSIASSLEKGLFCGLLAAGAVLIATYSIRSINALVAKDRSRPSSILGKRVSGTL
jgi:hypothetical protein